MTEPAFLDAIGRTADILAAMEHSIMDQDRLRIEALTFDLHAALAGINGCMPNSQDERERTQKVFETTLRLEKLLAERMASDDSAGIRRKNRHRPGRVSYRS